MKLPYVEMASLSPERRTTNFTQRYIRRRSSVINKSTLLVREIDRRHFESLNGNRYNFQEIDFQDRVSSQIFHKSICVRL